LLAFDPAPVDLTDALRLAHWTLARAVPPCTFDTVHAPDAFAIADANQADLPVIYASDAFQAMTGYSRDEIVGRNCRFLQSPPDSNNPHAHINLAQVQELSAKVQSAVVCQHVIPNFTKSGELFLNSITLVPVLGGLPSGLRLIFSFSVDITNTGGLDTLTNSLSESSALGRRRASITGRLRAQVDHVSFDSPDTSIGDRSSQPSTRPTSSAGSSDPSSRDAHSSMSPAQASDNFPLPKYLPFLALDQLDDLAFVLSPKGIVHYATPSCRALGVEAVDLTAMPFQNLCHPSDMRLVLRHLATITSTQHDEMLFRLQTRGTGSWAWFACSGTLWHDPGTRRLVVLSGRLQATTTLPADLVACKSSFGDRDLWLRITPSGLVLSVLSAVSAVFSLSADVLRGASFQGFIEQDDAEHFHRMLAEATNGNVVTATCRLDTTSDYDLRAEMTLYPDLTSSVQSAPTVLLRCRLTKALHEKRTATKVPNLPIMLISSDDTTRRAPVAHTDANTNVSVMPSSSQISLPAVISSLSVNVTGTAPLELHLLRSETTALQAELAKLEAAAKQRARQRRGGAKGHMAAAIRQGLLIRGCANCHVKNSPEWRRGPSGYRDLCNRCGLRYAKDEKTTATAAAAAAVTPSQVSSTTPMTTITTATPPTAPATATTTTTTTPAEEQESTVPGTNKKRQLPDDFDKRPQDFDGMVICND